MGGEGGKGAMLTSPSTGHGSLFKVEGWTGLFLSSHCSGAGDAGRTAGRGGPGGRD